MKDLIGVMDVDYFSTFFFLASTLVSLMLCYVFYVMDKRRG